MGRVRALVVAAVLAATGTVVGVGSTTLTAAPVAAAVDPTPTIDPSNRASVWAAYQSSLVEPKGVPVGWTGSTSTCTEGTESAASIEATRAALNFYRGLVGLPGLPNASADNADAMRAALLQSANTDRGLSHYPPSDWRCWTQARYDASAGHNLASLPGAQGVELYMVDPGDSNDFAGHRNWLLHPRGTAFATGSTATHNAIDIQTGGSVPAGVDWIAWPNEGFVPKAIVQPYVWWSKTLFSVRNAAVSYDWSEATATVKVGSTSLPVEIRDRLNQLTWYTTLPSTWATSGDVKLDITISGLKTPSGSAVAPYSYSSTAITSGSTTPPATAPGAPTGVTASAGNGQATVSWTAPTSNGGSTITGYRITPYAGTTPLTARTTTGATTTTFTGLTNGTPLTFRVQAVNAIGTSTPSAPSNTVTPTAPATAPGAPTGVTASAGNGQATVSWTAPTSNGGSTITGYRITPYAGTTPLTARTTTGATTTTFTGLTNGTPLTFRVQAVNAIGTSTPSAPSNTVTPTAPAVPYSPYRSWADLLDQTYRHLMGRPPTTAERNQWLGPLQNGTRTPGALVAALRQTAHHGLVDQATRLYTAYFLRLPEPDGLEYWVGERLRGRSLGSTSAFFARSGEFQTLYGTLTHRQFVERIYRNILGRAGEAGGVTYWTNEITSGRRTRGSVMLGFSEAKEYREAKAAEVHVGVIYALWLDRLPTVDERTAGVTALRGGTSVAAFADGLRPQAAVLP